MTDLATTYINFSEGMDLALDGLLLQDDDGLTTAVILSLYTDRRARPDDILPNADQGSTDRRGWVGDDISEVQGDQIGSLLWLNESAKQLQKVLTTDRQYAEDALAWLVTDEIASRVEVVTSNPSMGIRRMDIAIHRPNQPVARFQFDKFWSNN